ncbi:metallopeptidase TldD-related protein [Bryobacter aggregatus]|uniref:metallopeptidase TldD-related protein n=1 Tax=Bryobacter aggregatus TaxID=360054 RepID=UPI00068E9B05|nr:metallopeptidase TldD-related protein [Bryobacter aggregatus]
MRSLPLFAVLLIPDSLRAQPKAVQILDEEMNRNFAQLKKADPPAYFLSYEMQEQEAQSVTATLGTLQGSNASQSRNVDISVRVGDAKLDNYRQIRGDRPQFAGAVSLPLDDEANALRRRLWLETDRVYRAGAQRLINIKTNQQMKLEGDDKSGDFSPVPVVVKYETVGPLKFDTRLWQERARKWSQYFADKPEVLASSVVVVGQRELKTFVNTDGTKLQYGRLFARIIISARGKAGDGMNLSASETFEAEDPSRLPDEKLVQQAVEKVHKKLAALLKAPLAEPFTGPAILSGKAAGVFFHEIFGHRIEGHRQKDETEGQTFTKMVGQKILPDFLSVKMDPTLHQLAGVDLYGWYDYDDEGVKARPVSVVKSGILENFLMSRSPINGFPESNGHGRKQLGAEVVSRQSNLVVESSKSVTNAALRNELIAEIKKQNKPYGLYFEEVSSGFTVTSRRGLQGFQVAPVMVYKVFADGRPDQLIRGSDIVGTPLTSFAKIAMTSNDTTVFNGYCGAESGQVPVSASAPALLVTEIEVSLRERSQERPPFLERPKASTISGVL